MPDNKIVSVKVDRDTCIGAGPCVATAPGVFELDDEQKAVIKKADGGRTSDQTNVSEFEAGDADDALLMAAAESCPVRAISLYDAAGTKIFPA